MMNDVYDFKELKVYYNYGFLYNEPDIGVIECTIITENGFSCKRNSPFKNLYFTATLNPTELGLSKLPQDFDSFDVFWDVPSRDIFLNEEDCKAFYLSNYY
jgi:hypothetical protein